MEPHVCARGGRSQQPFFPAPPLNQHHSKLGWPPLRTPQATPEAATQGSVGREEGLLACERPGMPAVHQVGSHSPLPLAEVAGPAASGPGPSRGVVGARPGSRCPVTTTVRWPWSHRWGLPPSASPSSHPRVQHPPPLSSEAPYGGLRHDSHRPLCPRELPPPPTDSGDLGETPAEGPLVPALCPKVLSGCCPPSLRPASRVVSPQVGADGPFRCGAFLCLPRFAAKPELEKGAQAAAASRRPHFAHTPIGGAHEAQQKGPLPGGGLPPPPPSTILRAPLLSSLV